MMTTRQPLRSALTRRLRLAAELGVCAVVALSGCKNSGKLLGRGGDGPGGTLTSRGDPLLGGARIPPQDLPVPGKDGYGSREKKDPLLGSPTGAGERGERADKPDNKEPTSRGSSKQPFRPGPETTNAALAGHLQTDDSELSIGDRRPLTQPVSRPRSSDGDREFEALTAELKRLGVKWTGPVREGNLYLLRCEVPLHPQQPGLVRSYEGAGPTPAAAARQALDQIQADRRR